MRWADPPEEVKGRLGTSPTIVCESCGEGWWDEEVHKEMAEAMDAESVKQLDEAVDGEECPECGHKQDRMSNWL